ncbi:MAG TPA: dTMP kinase [Parcubacteria group bacterium]|jgi:dTMP kinase|nr:dTMP kinase [Parcubacteria group bacterium]
MKAVFLEGLDGCGKTTFINHLKSARPDFIFSREPGGLGLSQKVRELVLSDDAEQADPLTMFNLFWASRAENVAKIIRPAITAGQVVISDRFDASTYAYQIGKNPDLEELFWHTREVCLRGVPCIYLDFKVSPAEATRRLKARGGENHFDRRSEEDRRMTRVFYDKFFSREGIVSIQVDADVPEERMISVALVALGHALDN